MNKMSMKKGKTYPHTWKSGPDEDIHKLYVDYQRAKAQAKFRGEAWELKMEEYITLWTTNNCHLHKGRSLDDYCLTRKDFAGAWSLDNVEILTRREHFQTRGEKIRAQQRL